MPTTFAEPPENDPPENLPQWLAVEIKDGLSKPEARRRRPPRTDPPLPEAA